VTPLLRRCATSRGQAADTQTASWIVVPRVLRCGRVYLYSPLELAVHSTPVPTPGRIQGELCVSPGSRPCRALV
jgi:hypothetical protein